MINEIIEKIFSTFNIDTINSLEKIEIGFSNKLYSINDKYIIKICGDDENEMNMEKEVFFLKLFENKIPVPKIVLFDNSKTLLDKYYLICHKIDGENVYSQWHLYTDAQRKQCIKQICKYLRIINELPYENYIHHFNINVNRLYDETLKHINELLKKIEQKNLIPMDFFESIKKYINKNKFVLEEEKRALVHMDIHFDNILIKNGQIVGLLDFEMMEITSIDKVLDVIKRMVDYPEKYMAEKNKENAKIEDYINLLKWVEEYYPELFDFKNINERLNIYSIEHDLNTLIWYPDSVIERKMIAKTIDYNKEII